MPKNLKLYDSKQKVVIGIVFNKYHCNFLHINLSPKFIFLAQISCLNSISNTEWIAYLISPVLFLKDIKVNISKQQQNKLTPDCPAQSKLATSPLSPTQSTAIPYFQLPGPQILGIILEFSFIPHIHIISNPAHTGFEIHPKSDIPWRHTMFMDWLKTKMSTFPEVEL